MISSIYRFNIWMAVSRLCQVILRRLNNSRSSNRFRWKYNTLVIDFLKIIQRLVLVCFGDLQDSKWNTFDNGNKQNKNHNNNRSKKKSEIQKVKVTATLPALRVTLSAFDISKLIEIATALADQVWKTIYFGLINWSYLFQSIGCCDCIEEQRSDRDFDRTESATVSFETTREEEIDKSVLFSIILLFFNVLIF